MIRTRLNTEKNMYRWHEYRESITGPDRVQVLLLQAPVWQTLPGYWHEPGEKCGTHYPLESSEGTTLTSTFIFNRRQTMLLATRAVRQWNSVVEGTQFVAPCCCSHRKKLACLDLVQSVPFSVYVHLGKLFQLHNPIKISYETYVSFNFLEAIF